MDSGYFFPGDRVCSNGGMMIIIALISHVCNHLDEFEPKDRNQEVSTLRSAGLASAAPVRKISDTRLVTG